MRDQGAGHSAGRYQVRTFSNFLHSHPHLIRRIHRLTTLTPFSSLSLFWDRPFEDLYSNIKHTSEYERRRVVSSQPGTSIVTPKFLLQMFNNDPVRTVKLSTFIKEMLEKAQTVCGPQNFNNQYVSKMDATVSGQLAKYLEA